MKRWLMVLLIALAVLAPSARAGILGPPVGVWEVKISGDDKGLLFLTFVGDGTVTGHGMTIESFGLFTVDGSWAGDSDNLTGTVTIFLGSISIQGSFTGKATATSLKLLLQTEQGESLSLKGKPPGVIPNATGVWAGTSTSVGTTSSEVVDITPAGQLGLYDVDGTGTGPLGDFTISGQLLIGTKGKGNAAIDGLYGKFTHIGASLTGKIDPVKGRASFKGLDDSGDSLKLKFTRQ